MTQSVMSPPNGAQPKPAAVDQGPANERTIAARPPLPVRRTAALHQARGLPGALVVASCAAIHLLAAALVYRRLAGNLYTLFDATPRLLVLEHGLTRLTAVTVFLPPVVPTTLVVASALWLGRRRHDPDTTRWLALSLVPLAIDSVLRMIGILLAPPPANVGELLDLPVRFSLGPRLALDLAGANPSPALGYWAVVATIPALISAWCVARALLTAEDAEREAVGRRRRRQRAPLDALQVGLAVAGTWVLIAFAGQVALPWAAQLFLKAFG